jgi:hypothetical protein
MGVAGAIEMALHVHGPAKLVALMPIVEGNLVLRCCLDVIIAGEIYASVYAMRIQCPNILVHLSLIFSRSKTSFAKTDRVLNILVRNAVQSGSFTGE